MNLKKKILPITLTLLLSVGSLGVAYAAAPTDYQQKMANWIQNDPNPMPMNMNMDMNMNMNSTNPNSGAGKSSNPSNSANQTTVNKQGTAQQQSNGTNQGYNMMPNMTPEQMLELDKAWMEKTAQKQQAPAGYNMMPNMTPEQMLELDKAWMEKTAQKQQAPTGSKNYQKSWSGNTHQQNWNSQYCRW